MTFRIECEWNYIKDEEYGDMYLYSYFPDTYLYLKTFEDLKRLSEIFDKHNCHVTCFGYCSGTDCFHIEIKGGSY